MQRNLVLLTIPPVLALALFAFFKSQEPQEIMPNQVAASSGVQIAQEGNEAEKPAIMMQKANPQIGSSSAQSTETQENKPLSPIEQIRAIKEKTALHNSILQDHDNFTRYPSQNVRVDRPERDPVSMVYETHERTTESEDKKASITVWTDQKYILTGGTVSIYARVDDQEKRGIANQLLSELIFNEQRSFGTFQLVDSDGDGIYSFTFGPDQSKEWPPGIYKALIVSSYKELSESVSFTVSPPVISLTGESREKLSAEGNLQVQLQVATTEPGRYYVRASLYTESGIPIGSSEYSEQLAKGEHWIPLQYFGLMIRDAGEPGPFRLGKIELAQSGVPMLRMPPVESDFYTQSYALDEFGSQTFREQQTLQ